MVVSLQGDEEEHLLDITPKLLNREYNCRSITLFTLFCMEVFFAGQ